ncbi:hypothetical protein L1277_001209 [Okibacterium sp. HSC-33S16]|nr:hypothetical protein [Okibacterium sp. HSC-33S16]
MNDACSERGGLMWKELAIPKLEHRTSQSVATRMSCELLCENSLIQGNYKVMPHMDPSSPAQLPSAR